MKNNETGLIRVNFSLRGFAKVVDLNALSKMTPDRRALVSFGYLLSGLQFQNDEPSTFPSIPEFRGVDYVGYIIEKERLDKSNGTWQRLEEFKIIGSKANSFKDSRVAYGETYRYRIRSVVKLTVASDNSKTRNIAVAKTLSDLVNDEIKTLTTQNTTLIQSFSVPYITAKKSTSSGRTVKISDNAKVKLDANGNPNLKFNEQSESEKQRLNALQGAIQDVQKALASSKPISDSVLETTISRLRQEGLDLQNISQGYVSQYFVGSPSKNWHYIVVTEQELPPAPQTIKIVPCSPKQNITLYWLPPVTSQRDLAAFNIYRRQSLGDTWDLIAEKLPINSVLYMDEDVVFDTTYIYAMSSFDVHGYESFLSTQIEAQLNSKFPFEAVEKPLRWISGGGARTDETNTIFKKFYPLTENIIAEQNIAVSPSKTYAGTSDKLLIRVKSLDTHEIKEIPIVVNNNQFLVNDL